jgi:hypothetical protein
MPEPPQQAPQRLARAAGQFLKPGLLLQQGCDLPLVDRERPGQRPRPTAHSEDTWRAERQPDQDQPRGHDQHGLADEGKQHP